ncbi:unannotated protein [freshwater metagenome]|uniref:Unannotated protein n=1 Tax=freshwater metagenome TaxID=449393 RepID=A0A6J7EU25_9ZZZZ
MRSTIEIAVSIAHRLLEVLILLVASIDARASAPTASTPDNLFKKDFKEESEPSMRP